MSELVLRADAGTRLGGGHFMRCLALAQAWIARGGRATFLTHAPGESWRTRAEAAGAAYLSIPGRHPDPADLETTLAYLGTTAPGSWLMLDGYDFTPEYHQAVRDAGHLVAAMDDVAHQPSYHVDVLVNQNLGAETIPYVTGADTLRRLGTRYALLRPEFSATPAPEREHPETAHRFLVTMGGGDPDNVTSRVLRALGVSGVRGEVDVVVGGSNPHRDALGAAAAELAPLGWTVRLLHDVREMRPLVERAEMAVSAGGSTCWELAYMGLPGVVLTLADNQEGIVAGLASAGAAECPGWHEDVTDEALALAVRSVAESAERRRALADAARGLVDGRGAERVAEALAARAASTRARMMAVRSYDSARRTTVAPSEMGTTAAASARSTASTLGG